MLDLNWLSEHLDEAREKTSWRHDEVDFDRLAELIAGRRDLIHAAESARHEQRQAQSRMKTMDKSGPDFQALREDLRELSTRAKALDLQRKELVEELDALILTIPNITHDSVPRGTSEEDNALIRTVGEPIAFDHEVLDHVDVGEGLGALDIEAAVRVAGARFAFLTGPLARLNRALIDFMLELHGGSHGYVEVVPPFLVNADAMTGTGQLPKFADEAFQTDDYYLIPTGEVPVANLHRGRILDAEQLPLRYVAYSPCFRREAGSYGKDTRGLIRQHQFEKVELIQLVRPENSYVALEELTGHAEKVLQVLELPYRVVSLSTGDIGFSSTKTYDLEVWLPSQQRYREISSCSNCEDFQARRADIRFRRGPGEKPEYVHTLNGSGLAVGRTLVAIIENYQLADGSVRVPDALVQRMGANRLEPTAAE